MASAGKEIKKLASEIEQSRKILIALGDEMRQHLILVMMQSGDCSGMRVGDIAEQTRLSRPAVSHYLQIMKDVFLYRAGWKVSNGALAANICLAIALLIIGFLLYKESISVKQVAGMIACGIGLLLVSG